MINNIEKIEELLTFENKNDFYRIFINRRKKDVFESLKPTTRSTQTITSYYIHSLKELREHYTDIMNICDAVGGRAYIELNPYNHELIPLAMIELISSRTKSGSVNQINAFDKALNKYGNKKNRWLIDIDYDDYENWQQIYTDIREFLRELKPHGYKIISAIGTKNGLHLITTKFDTKKFKERFGEDLAPKKNCATLLYMK